MKTENKIEDRGYRL